MWNKTCETSKTQNAKIHFHKSVLTGASIPVADHVMLLFGPMCQYSWQKKHTSAEVIFTSSTFRMFQSTNLPRPFSCVARKKKCDTVFCSTWTVWTNVLWHARVQRSEAGTNLAVREIKTSDEPCLLCIAGRPAHAGCRAEQLEVVKAWW